MRDTTSTSSLGALIAPASAPDDATDGRCPAATLAAVTLRIMGGIGRTLIAVGVIVLLFTGYQLWGTGIQHARAQSALGEDFAGALAQAAELTERETTPTPTSSPRPEPQNAPGHDGDPEPTEEPFGDDGDPEPIEEPFELRLDSLQSEFDEAGVGFETMGPELVDGLSLLYPEPGEALVRLTIPAIGLDETVVEGVGVEDLRKGPGHYSSTPLPGQEGNAAIAGHRTTYGAPFHDLDKLAPGDEIIVQTIQGTFTYEVIAQEAPDGTQRGHVIVAPSATEVLRDFGDNRLTLTACHPKYSARQRIIVHAELVGEPVVTFPRPQQLEAGGEPSELAAEDVDGAGAEREDDGQDADDIATVGGESEDGGDGSAPDPDGAAGAQGESASGSSSVDAGGDGDTVQSSDGRSFVINDTVTATEGFGAGLGGDLGAVPPAVAWAVAAGFIWLAAWFVSRRWRRWPSYAIGLIPFLVVLFFSFQEVDRALPAY